MESRLDRPRFRRRIAVLALTFGAQASAELVLHEDDDFRGRSFRANGEITNLAPLNFNDRTSSVVVSGGGWELCDAANFGGQCITLSSGSYRSLREFGLNDRVSSVRPADGGGAGGGSGSVVQMFEHADFRGRSMDSDGSPNLARDGLNDRVSSIVIGSGRWEFCVDANYRGRCTTLPPGRYEKLSDIGLNDQISSLRRVGGRPQPGRLGDNNGNDDNRGRAPSAAVRACNRFADQRRDGDIVSQNAMKPGWWEIVLRFEGNQYVCNVSSSGQIESFNKIN